MGLVTENPAVLPYIAQQTGRLPQGKDMFRLLEWIGFVGTEIHTGYGPLFGGAGDDEQAEAKESLAETYGLADRLMDGNDWLVGDAPTVADNYLFVTLLWADKFGVEVPQALADYRTRNLERPAVRQAMKDEKLA
jgi:glutathione S-transferase